MLENNSKVRKMFKRLVTTEIYCGGTVVLNQEIVKITKLLNQSVSHNNIYLYIF